MSKTHRANYGFLQWTSGNAKDCIRSLSNQGCIVQRVILQSDRPAIRIKPDAAGRQLGEFIEVQRGEQKLAEISLCGCTVYWEVKEQ